MMISLKDSTDKNFIPKYMSKDKKRRKITKSQTVDDIGIRKKDKKALLIKTESDILLEWLNHPLKPEEIEQANRRIKKLHPFQNVSIFKLFKILGEIKMCVKSKDKKKNFQEVAPVKKKVFGEMDVLGPEI